MPETLFEHGFSGNYPKVLAKNMQFQSLKYTIWNRWMGFTTPGGAAIVPKSRPRPVDMPVVVHNELRRAAGELLEVPIHRQLKNLPKVGNEQMKDQEERPQINFAQIPIELTRHAELPQDGSMSAQTTKDLRLLDFTKPALQRHYIRVIEYLKASYAMYYGYSWNVLTSSRWAGDAKIFAYSHPHIYTSGGGKVAYGGGFPTTAGYETTIGTDLTAMGASDLFDTAFLQGLKADPEIRKIKPVLMKNGNELRFILAHPWQITALENDSAFRETQNHALAVSMAKDNALLFAVKYIYAGFAIFESDTAVWRVDVPATTPVWGPATITDLDSFEDYASATMFGALVIGSNALTLANGSAMEFRRRNDDYGEIIGIAYRIISGMSRGDYLNRDDGTTGSNIVQEGSAIAATRAAAPTF